MIASLEMKCYFPEIVMHSYSLKGSKMTVPSRIAGPDLAACFVVMPFGVKQFDDGSRRQFDFDKIYRVVIKRAVREAGLEPLRADEQIGSQIIHIDMFKALRDRAIVVVDLSLENPNVFYELGVRHVMSPRGTVLICRKGAQLPFDVSLSRVIFYSYDGVDLDWEEAERLVVALKTALEEAKRGRPDSPVHALLERVLSGSTMQNNRGQDFRVAGESVKALEPYQRLIAEYWRKQGKDGKALIATEHGRSVFGCRALGYYCLNNSAIPENQIIVVDPLFDLEQYDLVNQIFAKLESSRALTPRELMRYGSSKSEEDLSIAGAKAGLEYSKNALALLEEQSASSTVSPETLETAFHCRSNISGLYFWMRMLEPKTEKYLERAIETLISALEDADRALQRLSTFPVGRYAQAHIKLLFMLRIQSEDRQRPDSEAHRDSVLSIPAESARHMPEASYLRWYKAMAWADLGERRRSQAMAIEAIAEDGRIKDQPGCAEIGRRQYSQLRRFLEQYSSWSPNSECFGDISQHLQIGQTDII